jgi:formylglycine-generating enzyme required for sulfatase activity
MKLFSWGSGRVSRGGGWNVKGGGCRAAFRSWVAPGDRSLYQGVRLARVIR